MSFYDQRSVLNAFLGQNTPLHHGEHLCSGKGANVQADGRRRVASISCGYEVSTYCRLCEDRTRQWTVKKFHIRGSGRASVPHNESYCIHVQQDMCSRPRVPQTQPIRASISGKIIRHGPYPHAFEYTSLASCCLSIRRRYSASCLHMSGLAEFRDPVSASVFRAGPLRNN